MTSSSDSCVTEVTTVISRLKTNDSEGAQNGTSNQVDSSTDPSPTESPASSLRFGGLIDEETGQEANTGLLYKCPIVGHEVMEERARFTVYKLRVENQSTGECWFIFRRYTDFMRLHAKLKCDFPNIILTLPRKRWFGDNFNPNFIDERTRGLQRFLDGVLRHVSLQLHLSVREFFCLDEPPCAVDSIDESRAIFEAFEETLQQLRGQLVDRELCLETTREALDRQTLENARLRQIIRDCEACSSKEQSSEVLDHPLS